MAQTVTSTSAPWSAQQPYLTRGFQQAQNLLNQGGPQYYPGQTVAPFGQDTNNALNMFRQQAVRGSGVPDAATGQLQQTLQGDYLNSNPYLDAMYNQAAGQVGENYREAVAPSIGAQFDSAGRYGSGMYQNMMQNSEQQLGNTLSGLASSIYGTNYTNERNNQMQALSMSPQVAPLSYYDASQLLNVGEMKDAKTQQGLTDKFNRYQFNQERPYDNLGRYMGYLGGSYGQTNTQPYNSTANTLGLVGTGLGLLDEVFGNPIQGLLGGIFR